VLVRLRGQTARRYGRFLDPRLRTSDQATNDAGPAIIGSHGHHHQGARSASFIAAQIGPPPGPSPILPKQVAMGGPQNIATVATPTTHIREKTTSVGLGSRLTPKLRIVIPTLAPASAVEPVTEVGTGDPNVPH
jgi:hypothetical protein